MGDCKPVFASLPTDSHNSAKAVQLRMESVLKKSKWKLPNEIYYFTQLI